MTHDRYPPAHHRRRRHALSFGAARRPSVRLVAHAAGDAGADDRRDGRGRRAKGRDRAGLDLLRPRQFLCRRCGRRLPDSASPACSPSTCWRPMRLNACATGAARGSPACGFSPSAARCPSRPTGSTIRNPIRPGACAGELGLSICLQMSAKAIPQAVGMAEALPERANHSRSLRAAGAGGRAAL